MPGKKHILQLAFFYTLYFQSATALAVGPLEEIYQGASESAQQIRRVQREAQRYITVFGYYVEKSSETIEKIKSLIRALSQSLITSSEIVSLLSDLRELQEDFECLNIESATIIEKLRGLYRSPEEAPDILSRIIRARTVDTLLKQVDKLNDLHWNSQDFIADAAVDAATVGKVHKELQEDAHDALVKGFAMLGRTEHQRE